MIAKENVIATFSTLGACLIAIANLEVGGLDIMAEEGVDAVQAMILATNISVPALLSLIAFNMTTIPCFASVATAKGELNSKTFKATMVFWIVISYVASSAVYLIGTWWWTAFIYLATFVALGLIIRLKNKRSEKQV